MNPRGDGRARLPRRPAVSLWASLACFYALTGAGHSGFVDGYLLFLTARSIVEEHTVSIPPQAAMGRLTRVGTDGRLYGVFFPALALAHLPALAAARLLPGVQPEAAGRTLDPLVRDEFWAQFTNAWVMATTATVLFCCGVALGFSTRASLCVVLLAAVAGPLWAYSRIDSTEALQSLSLVGAAYFVIRGRWLAVGAMLALVILTKPTNVILVPWFLITCWTEAGRARRIATARAVGPVIASLLAVGLYDQVRFGSPLDVGYSVGPSMLTHDPIDGAAVLLLSPSYGLLFFWPASALAIVGAVSFGRKFPREALLIGGVFLTLLAVYAPFRYYWGTCWGPRYLIPAVPLLALFLLPLATKPRGWLLAMIVASAVLGVAVQGIAVGSSYWQQVIGVTRHLAYPGRERFHRDPRVSPLRLGAWWVRAAVVRHVRSEERALDEIRHPPWNSAFPWRDPSAAVADLAGLRGLDLWAAPAGWRMPYRSIRREPTGFLIPSSPPLRVLLAASGFLAFLSLAASIARGDP